MVPHNRDVRFVPKADSCTATKRRRPHVRFTSKSGDYTARIVA
jgi:hypothetical protein